MDSPIVPDHRLLRPIGRGAYGEVWLARNIMGTARAVKVIWRRQFESARPFEREFAGIQRFEPVSRSSGGLVHVLHVGRNETEGCFYYVMELADDAEGIPAESTGTAPLKSGSPSPPDQISDSYRPRTLRSDLKSVGRLSTAECLRLAVEVVSGLAQLHRHGLIHRDVKPGNIIFVNGRAKLADIGLVTAEGEGRTFVGTEGYVPPEGPGSPSADLYALGIVLYEASTGFAPEQFPDVPPEWFTTSAGDQALEFHEIVLKACEGQRERRYTSVDSMQADLALLQSGVSVRQARALQRRYARLRFAGATGAICLALVLGAFFFANYRARLEAASRAMESQLRQQAQQAQAKAESAEHEARRQLQDALYEQARAMVVSQELGQRTRALEAIHRAAGSTNLAALRRVAFAALGLPDLRLEQEVALPGRMTFAKLDPKFERIALGNGRGPVTIFSIPDLRFLASLAPTSTNRAFTGRWSADGRFLAVRRQHDDPEMFSDLEVWDVGRTQLLFTAGRDIAYDSFCFHPQLPRLMTGHIGGTMRIWNLENLKEANRFQLPDTPCALDYSPQGDRFATSYRQGSNWVAAIHDSTSGEVLGSTPCDDPAYLIAWHPGGDWISVAGDTGSEWNRGVRLIPVSGGVSTLLGQHKLKTSGIAFSPDGNYLVSCSWERELFCWDLRTRRRAFTLGDSGYDLDWNSDGTRCATVPPDRLQLQLYRFERPDCLELTGNQGKRLRPGAFSPDGRWLALADDENLCVWDLTSNSPPARLPDHTPIPPFFSADSSELFALDGEIGSANLKIWRASPASGRTEPPRLTPLPVSVGAGLTGAGLAGDKLVLTSTNGVQLLAVTSLAAEGDPARTMPPGQGIVSPDGRWLALTYSYSPKITVFRLPEMKMAADLETSNFVAGVWFSPTGEEMTVINRGGVEQWDTATWRLMRCQPGSPLSGSYVIYTPDGSGLWQVTSFRDTALYDRKTAESLLPLPSNVLPLAVSRDGCKLAVSVDDQRVQVWNLAELHGKLRELDLDWTTR